MGTWQLVDLGETAERLRERPELRDVAGATAPDGTRYVIVEQQGFHYGPAVRNLVLDELSPDDVSGSEVAVAVSRELPRTSDGRLDPDKTLLLLERIVEDGNWVFTYEPPATDHEQAVIDLLLEVLPGGRVSMSDTLALLGADSLVLVELSVALADRFGAELTPMDLFETSTVRDLAERVAPQSASRVDR